MTENRRNAVRWFLSAPELRGPLVVLCATLLVVLLSVIVAGLTSNAEGFLTGLAALSRAVAWPVALVLLLIAFRDSIVAQFGRVRSVELVGGKVEFDAAIEMRLQESATEAGLKSIDENQGVSSGELDRAQVINRLSTTVDVTAIRQRMLDLATEYRFVRGSMPSGAERTRAMTVVMSQMRTLGQAAFPLRGEFAFSSDPGQRLAAVAIAQVQPDLAMLDWIAGRISLSEKPFIQYQAIAALLIAARNADAAYADALKRAYATASANYSKIATTQRTDRADLLKAVEAELAYL